MMVSQEQLDQFHRFAAEKISGSEAGLTWPELFNLWLFSAPNRDEQAEIYAALDESTRDIENGDHRPAGDVIRELREKH